jgi:hypothetical protein
MIEDKKYYCFQCGEELTPENDGILINDEFAQCDDCHEIEYGVYIWPMLLLYDKNGKRTDLKKD